MSGKKQIISIVSSIIIITVAISETAGGADQEKKVPQTVNFPFIPF